MGPSTRSKPATRRCRGSANMRAVGQDVRGELARAVEELDALMAAGADRDEIRAKSVAASEAFRRFVESGGTLSN